MTLFTRFKTSVGIAFASIFVFLPKGWADVVFYTDEAAWRATVSGEEDFGFSAANVAQANEVASAPGNNAQLGGLLTFESVNTGLSSSFTLTALETGAGFTFNDNEGNSSAWNNALSIGDINNFENDDFQITFDSSTVYAFGWWLVDNGVATDESFRVYDKDSDSLVGTLTTIPVGSGVSFIGFISTVAIGRVVFDEDAGSDDVAINGIVMSASSVPEPSGLLVVMLGAAASVFRRRR